MADTYVNIKTSTVNENVPTKATFGYYMPKVITATLKANSWSNNSQTISVKGVLADEKKQLIIPIPTANSAAAYKNAGIYCVSQAANSLSFINSVSPSPVVDIDLLITIQAIL